MPGESNNIADIAKKVSQEIFRWFKWKLSNVTDENFECNKPKLHKKNWDSVKSGFKPEHPVDVVFSYYDPYIDKEVYLNTDLKCYSKSSITPKKIQIALESMGRTVQCARASEEWQQKYITKDYRYEVRGMVFMYNHDDEYDNDLLERIKKINLENLPIAENNLIHLLDPKRILYLYTVVTDIQKLIATQTFPSDGNYSFLYPDLTMHKELGDTNNQAATIETLCSPYMIIKYGKVRAISPENNKQTVVTSNGGYLVYYNQSGATHEEFMYLFDNLSRFQILNDENVVKIRVAHKDYHQNIKSNFDRAKELYVQDWGLDEYKRKTLESIELEAVTHSAPNYNPGLIAWKEQND